MSDEADVLLAGDEDGVQEEISQEDAEALLADEEDYGYTESDYAAGGEWSTEQQESAEGDENTADGEKDNSGEKKSESSEKKDDNKRNDKYGRHPFRGGPRGRMMMRMPFPPRFPFGPRLPPGVRLPPPFMMRPGMRPPPGFRGRMPPPGMRMRFPPRPPFPPGHPMFRRGMMMRPPHPGMRPGMRPMPPFHPGMMGMHFDEDWEEEEEEDQQNGENKIKTVIAGSGDASKKRPAPMNNMGSAPKRGRGAPPPGRLPTRGGGQVGRGAGAPHIRGGRVANVNQMSSASYNQPASRSVTEVSKSGGGQCHSNLRTIQCTDTLPPVQTQPRAQAISTRGGRGMYHQPSPTLTSVPIQVTTGMNLPRSDKKVLVQNLPASISYDRIYQMAVQYGPITSLETKPHEKSAVIEFVSPNSAELFTRTHNRKMMDLAIITVTRLL